MVKIKISSADLAALFAERLKRFSECPDGIMIAIIPDNASVSGWSTVINSAQRGRHPRCTRRIQTVENQLSKIYVLAKD